MTNPLTDLIPPKYRRYVYAVVALAALVYGAYEASNGDIRQTVIAVLGALVSSLAHSNTSTTSGLPGPDAVQ